MEIGFDLLHIGNMIGRRRASVARIPLFVMTDFDATAEEFDDEITLAALLSMQDIFDIKGICIGSKKGDYSTRTGLVTAYGTDYTTLVSYETQAGQFITPANIDAIFSQGTTNLGDLEVPDTGYFEPVDTGYADAENAADVLFAASAGHDKTTNPLWVLATGPYSDLAHALFKYPALRDRIRVMSGSDHNRAQHLEAFEYIFDNHQTNGLWWMHFHQLTQAMWTNDSNSQQAFTRTIRNNTGEMCTWIMTTPHYNTPNEHFRNFDMGYVMALLDLYAENKVDDPTQLSRLFKFKTYNGGTAPSGYMPTSNSFWEPDDNSIYWANTSTDAPLTDVRGAALIKDNYEYIYGLFDAVFHRAESACATPTITCEFNFLDTTTLTLRNDAGTDYIVQANDISGNGIHLAQATEARQPRYDSGLGAYFDNVDDFMVTAYDAALDTDGVTVLVLLNCEGAGASPWKVVVSRPYRNDGTWTTPHAAYKMSFGHNRVVSDPDINDWHFAPGGTADNLAANDPYATPMDFGQDHLLMGRFNHSTGEALARVNGGQDEVKAGTASALQTLHQTGVVFGSRSDTSPGERFFGHMKRAVVAPYLTDGEINHILRRWGVMLQANPRAA